MTKNTSDKGKHKNRPKKVREGQEDNSILHDMDRQEKKSYPRPGTADRQFDNQPEFIEPDSSRKDEAEET